MSPDIVIVTYNSKPALSQIAGRHDPIGVVYLAIDVVVAP